MDRDQFVYIFGSLGNWIEYMRNSSIISDEEIEKCEACYCLWEGNISDELPGKYVALTPDDLIMFEYYHHKKIVKVKRINRSFLTLEKEIQLYSQNGYSPSYYVQKITAILSTGEVLEFPKPENSFRANAENYRRFAELLG